eukprot:TRINITY_DN9821_c0_g1_i1.p1 TRINITY_DN9821_c0_g1~~TRINITY_DN9821_c0_g1_i1.p1  ORF type:complete len:249 (-),score=32.47 TRINITY_DN9821_c0_g1_i1:63-809(-)
MSDNYQITNEKIIDFEVNERIVFIVGKTGSGKSNLINHILSKNIAASCKSATNITRDIKKYRSFRMNFFDHSINDLNLFDTPGFFDSEMNNNQIANIIASFLTSLTFVNCVFIVLRQDRITDEFITSLKESFKLFNKENLHQFVKIIITHCDPEEETNYITSFLTNNLITKIMEEFKLRKENFIFVDLNLKSSDMLNSKNHRDVGILNNIILNSVPTYSKSDAFSIMTDEKQKQQNYVQEIMKLFTKS